MDAASMLLQVVAPFLPSPVTSFLRGQINAIANGADDILSQYLPASVASSIRSALPVVMSLFAMYFGLLSFWRTARGALRTGYTLFKFGFLAFIASTAYNFYQGNGTASLQNSYATAASSLSAASTMIGPIGTLATWWIGRENIDVVKKFAASAGFPIEDKSTAPKKGKASSGSSWADAFAPGNGKKAEAKTGGLLDGLAGMFGGKDGEDVVKNFVDRVAGGGDAGGLAKNVFDIGKAALGDDGSKKKKKKQ